MSVRVYRGLMNIIMLLCSVYWAAVLYQVTVDGTEVVSAPLRFVGYLLIFAVVVLALTAYEIWGDNPKMMRERAKVTILEGVYWWLNSILFFVFLLVGAIK